MKNSALIFIKPHAVRPKAVEYIEQFLTGHSISLEGTGELSSQQIKTDKIIDRHYFAIAAAAVDRRAGEQDFSEEAAKRFENSFGLPLLDALESGKLLNSEEAQQKLGGIDGVELNRLWTGGSQTKLGPGLYAGKLAGMELYVLNGFYPAMKERFTAPGLTIRWYDAKFDPDKLSWSDFRNKVVGATDPEKSVAGSLRSELLKRYREFGLKESPSMTNNGVHASAGPIEGLRERMVWLGADPYTSPLGQALLAAGFSREQLGVLLNNGTARFGGEQGPVFDITEDTDARNIPGHLSPAT